MEKRDRDDEEEKGNVPVVKRMDRRTRWDGIQLPEVISLCYTHSGKDDSEECGGGELHGR